MRAGSLLLALGAWALSAAASLGAIDYSSVGLAYSQNFDSLAASGASASWTNDITIPGWHLFRRTSASDATPVAVTSYHVSDGTASTGGFYSFGSTGTGERALGGVGSGILSQFGASGSVSLGTVIGWIAVSFTNDTGEVLPQFTVAYDGEQWRDGGNNPPQAQTMVFEYGFGSSFAAVSNWTAPGGAFDFTSPVFSTPAGPVDGNAAGLVENLGGTITGLTWADGQTLWLRWIEVNDIGADHGLAVDNFSFSAGVLAAVPEPSAFLFGGLVCCVAGAAALRPALKRRAAAGHEAR